MNKICPVCKQEFISPDYIFPSLIYCSPSCEAMDKRNTRTCKVCGISFTNSNNLKTCRKCIKNGAKAKA